MDAGIVPVIDHYAFTAAHAEDCMYTGKEGPFRPESHDERLSVLCASDTLEIGTEMPQRLSDTVRITAEKPQQQSESLHIEGDVLQRMGLFQVNKCIMDSYDFTAVEAHMTDAVAKL